MFRLLWLFLIFGVLSFIGFEKVHAQESPIIPTLYCLGSCQVTIPLSQITPTIPVSSTSVPQQQPMQQISITPSTTNVPYNNNTAQRHIKKEKGLLNAFIELLLKILEPFLSLISKFTGNTAIAPSTPSANPSVITSPVMTSPSPSSAVPTKSSIAGSPGCGLPVTAGKKNETLVVGGVTRTYVLVVPSGLDPNMPVPIIMGFHGGSDTGEHASQYMGLTGTEPALYVYPQAPYWAEAGGVGWNVDPDGVDFPYFDTLLSELGKKHCVDITQVFVAGKSNGGFFVNALACHRPQAIRGIASVAGGGPSAQCAKSNGMGAMIIHGSADTTVPFSQGMESLDFWRQTNSCAGAAVTPTTPSNCVTYSGCTKRILWCEHTGAHDWPTWAGAGIRNFFLGL